MPGIHGPGAALVTLRCPDGNIDTLAMRHLATRVVAHGATSILVAGTTGQSHQCTISERLSLVRAVAAAGVPVIVGLPGQVTARLASEFRAAGADAALAGQADNLHVALSACTSAGLPLLAYHHPVHALHLDARTVAAAQRDGLAGVKDSSGDPQTLHSFIATGIPTYAGGTPVLASARTAGAAGVLSGLGSAFPKLVAQAWEGNTTAHAVLQDFDRSNPDRIGALKAVAAARTQP